MTILVVEDNARMRQHIHKLLEQHISTSVKIIECKNAAESIIAFQKEKPQWIIMDVKLNGQNGLYATAKIHKSDPAVKIIVITQYAENAYRQEARRHGAFAFVPKEHLMDLVSLINSVL